MKVVSVLLLLISNSLAFADELSITPGQFSDCSVCHGVELKGNKSTDAPKLNGLAPWYVQEQLHAFKSGIRGTHRLDLAGMEMMPLARAMTDEQLTQAATYVGSIPVRTSRRTLSGNVINGKMLYNGCVACHGPAGKGMSDLHAPQLAGQNDWYLVRQLENYRAGIRGFDASDTWGRQMAASARALADRQEIIDVVAYINTLQDIR